MIKLEIHPCPSAAERQLAHAIERKLDPRNCQPDEDAVVNKLKALIPELRRPEHCRHMDLLRTCKDGRTVLQVVRYTRPYLTVTL